MGVPVIGADVRGTRDLIADGCGVIVPVGDVNRFADAMDKMADGTGRTYTLGLNAVRMSRKYDVTCLCEKLLGIMLGIRVDCQDEE